MNQLLMELRRDLADSLKELPEDKRGPATDFYIQGLLGRNPKSIREVVDMYKKESKDVR